METCEWKENSNEYEVTWQTSCGEEFVLLEGTPEENGLKFCPYCGRNLTMRAADVCQTCGSQEIIGLPEDETIAVCGDCGTRR